MERQLCAFNTTQPSFVALRVGCADTLFSRLRGLLFSPRLANDEGLWVVPSRGIHTIGVTFPTDVVYLDSNLRVIYLLENLAPFRIGPIKVDAHTVLILPARAIVLSKIQLGDRLLICRPELLKSLWQQFQHETEQVAT